MQKSSVRRGRPALSARAIPGIIRSVLFDAANSALGTLNRSGAWYALCGGLALGVHGHVRATRDIDVWFAGPGDAEGGMARLVADGWTPAPDVLPLPDGVAIHRLHRTFGDDLAVLDCIVPPEDLPWSLERERSELDGMACWVLDRRSLLRLKRWSDRPQDRADIAALGGDDDD